MDAAVESGVTAGVFGATGYVGRECVRLLRRHPRARLAFTTGSGHGHLAHEAGLDQPAGVFFLCLPHGVSATYAARLRASHPDALVIDLSGDLRLPTPEAYEQWYGHAHPAPELLATGVPYGLAEIAREELRGARLIANPGCYATSVLLPLVPLLRLGLCAPDDIVVDAKSGASGAGRTLREDLLFCELHDDFWPYAAGRAHRHVGEMEAVLRSQAGADVTLTFCPHLLPVKRGILSALYLRSSRSPQDLADALRGFYAGAAFVHVDKRHLPRLSDVQLTNDCRIGLHAAAPGRVVVFSALDNLVKGAAGQAIQNMNIALGWDEALGLQA